MVIYGPKKKNTELKEAKLPALENFYSKYGFSSLEINNSDSKKNYADTHNDSK